MSAINIPAFFLEGPPSPPFAPQNPAVNLAKCSSVYKTGAAIPVDRGKRARKVTFPGLYFRGCGVTWFFQDNQSRNAKLREILANPWVSVERDQPKPEENT